MFLKLSEIKATTLNIARQDLRDTSFRIMHVIIGSNSEKDNA